MAKRRVKPLGKQHWTWREIEAGYKMTQGQRSASHRWEQINKAGPGFTAFAIIALIVFSLLAWIAGGMKP